MDIVLTDMVVTGSLHRRLFLRTKKLLIRFGLVVLAYGTSQVGNTAILRPIVGFFFPDEESAKVGKNWLPS